MVRKKCKRCGLEKVFDEFYAHKRMADGRLNVCKKCTRKRVLGHRKENIDRIREYDRRRAYEPYRLKQLTENTKAWREKNPEGYRAQNMVNNCLRDGKIFRKPCEVCGKAETHAHHDDYSKPLEVRWLCAEHHKGVL